MRSSPSALAAAAVLAGAVLTAQAQSICDQGPYRERIVDRYEHAQCLRENVETARRVAALQKAFERRDKHPVRIAREQLELQRDQVGQRIASADAEPVKKAVSEAAARIAALENMEELADRTATAILQSDTWKPGSRPDALPRGLAARILGDAGCLEDSGSAPCEAAFRRATAVGDEVFVAYKVIVELHADMGDRFRDLAELRTQRWRAYLYDTQFQYWWELGINRWREETCWDRFVVNLFDECRDQKRDRYDNPQGFREPPTNRAIFLHPDVGLQYIDAEPDGDRLKPTLLVQWVGYQWWRWKDNGAKVESLRGVSFVSTLSDNAASKALGWGAMFQLNEYAIAFTGHGSKLAITFNLTLGDRISKLDEEWAERLKKLKKD